MSQFDDTTEEFPQAVVVGSVSRNTRENVQELIDRPIRSVQGSSRTQPQRMRRQAQSTRATGRQELIGSLSLAEVCGHLTALCYKNGMQECENFLEKNPGSLKLLKKVMTDDLYTINADQYFNKCTTDIMTVVDKNVHYSLSASFAQVLPDKFNYFILANLPNCRVWIGALFRKHLIARAGLARIENMPIETRVLVDLRRIVATAVITEDAAMLEVLEKIFFQENGEITMRYKDTIPYHLRKSGAMLPGDPFYAAGLIGNFNLTYILLRMCKFEGDHRAKHQEICTTAHALKVRHKISEKPENYLQVNNILEAVSDEDEKALIEFQKLDFIVPKKLLEDGEENNDNLHQVCQRWMTPGINFPALCKFNKARLVVMMNFRLHFATHTLQKRSGDIMLASAVVNTLDHSLFQYLRKRVFVHRVLRGIVTAHKSEKEQIFINNSTRMAHKQVMVGEGLRKTYVTYLSVLEAVEQMGMADSQTWRRALQL